MAEKELTPEQKEFISSLAVNPEYAKDVNKLREIKNAMLEGMSIEEAKKILETKTLTQNPRAEPEEKEEEINTKKEETIPEKVEDNDLGKEEVLSQEIEQDLYQMDYMYSDMSTEVTHSLEALEVQESIKEDIEPVVEEETDKYKKIKQEDTAKLLRMAQDAVHQLEEIKLKYEIMDEFIHKHIFEQKEQEISELHERNRKLEEEIARLKSTIRASPEKNMEYISNETIHKENVQESRSIYPKEEIVLPEKKKGIFLNFLKKESSENYIIRLFSNPKFTAEQIAEIRLGLEADLSEKQIKSYAKQDLSVRQMKEIRMLYEMQNQKRKEQ